MCKGGSAEARNGQRRASDLALPRRRLRHRAPATLVVARLSAYHFARQFKRATGLPPHQYVILRRVERAQQLLQGGGDLSLAEVAARVNGKLGLRMSSGCC
jgi:AraC family transcriptional regulator